MKTNPGWEFFPIGTPKYMQKALDRLRKPQPMVNSGPNSTLISTQEHIQGKKYQKERTASYHRELTFSDFKVGNQDKHIAQLDCLSRQIPLVK